MKKLKKKVFYTILGIFTISILSFIVVFNIQNYFEQKNTILRSFNMVPFKDDNFPGKNFDDKNIRYMDSNIYTVILDNKNNIIEILNHSNEENDNDFKSYVENLLKEDNLKKENISSLLFDKYSYSYNNGKSLVIVDNSFAKEKILVELKTSISIFVILEMIIIYISKLITNWIIQPVEETFNKQKELLNQLKKHLINKEIL